MAARDHAIDELERKGIGGGQLQQVAQLRLCRTSGARMTAAASGEITENIEFKHVDSVSDRPRERAPARALADDERDLVWAARAASQSTL